MRERRKKNTRVLLTLLDLPSSGRWSREWRRRDGEVEFRYKGWKEYTPRHVSRIIPEFEWKSKHLSGSLDGVNGKRRFNYGKKKRWIGDR